MRMSSSFHLAIPAGDLKKAEAFYTNILGCKTGKSPICLALILS